MSYDPRHYDQVEMIEERGIVGWVGKKRKNLIVNLLQQEALIGDKKVAHTKTLDVGCGYGEILSESPGIEKYGVDINLKAIGKAKNRLTGCQLIVSDVLTLPFQSDVFDYVICSEVLEHLDNPEDLVAELTRVTKRRGFICVTFPNEIANTIGRFILGLRPYKSIAHIQSLSPSKVKRLFLADFLKTVNLPFPFLPFFLSINSVLLFRKT